MSRCDSVARNRHQQRRDRRGRAWLKQPATGSRAAVIAEVSTDKVNIEIESPVAGVLEAIVAKEGDTVVEGDPLARVAAEAG